MHRYNGVFIIRISGIQCVCVGLRNTNETKHFTRYLLVGISFYLFCPLTRMTVGVRQSIIVQSASSDCCLLRFVGMEVLQYLRYCNSSGSLTLLPCRVVNNSLWYRFSTEPKAKGANPNKKTMSMWQHQGRLMYGIPNISRNATAGTNSLHLF